MLFNDTVINLLRNYSSSNGNLIHFIQKNLPYFVFDSYAIEQLINNGISEEDIAINITYCLDILKFINEHRIHEANANALDPYAIYIEQHPYRFDETLFSILYDAVSKIDITDRFLISPKRAKDIVELLSNFPVSIEEKAKIINSIVSKDEDRFIRAGRMLVDAGCDYDLISSTFNKVELNINKEKNAASDALSVLLHDRDNSDSALETCFIFDRLTALCVSENLNNVIFINPSPFFVKRCLANKILSSVHIAFAFENEFLYKAFALRNASINCSFESFDRLRRNSSYISMYDGVFIFGNETNDKGFINCLLEYLSSNSYHDAKLVILDADTYTIKNSYTKHLLGGIKIDSITLLPFSIKGLKEPKRKSIIELSVHKHFDLDNIIDVFEYKPVTNGKYPAISAKFDVMSITQNDYIESPKTIRKLYYESVNGNTTEKRKAYSISFSPELIIDYSCSGSNPVRLRACFREPSASTSKGHKALTSLVSTALKPPVDVEKWLFETYPFLKHEEKGTTIPVRNVMQEYRGLFVSKRSLSLRTLLYLYPEIEDSILDKYKSMIRTIMLHDLSTISLNALSINNIEVIANDISSDYSELTGYHTILDTLSKIFEFANAQGYKNSNPAKQLIKELKPNEYTPFDIKQNLGRNHLDHSQRTQLINCCFKIKKSKPAMYLAIMLRYITALLPQEICALKWRDYCRVYDFNVLKISRLISKDAKEFVPLKTRTQYRNIPIPPRLNRLIADEKESQLKKYKCTEEQLMEMSIIAGKDGIIDGYFAAMSPERLYKESRSIINSLDNNEDIIWITDNDNKYEIDLSATPGDIFRSNYKHFAAVKSIFEDDIAYFLMGIQNKDVFSYNYCDFNNHECLKLIYPDQCKLEEVILDGKNI